MAIELPDFSPPSRPRGKEGVVFYLAGEKFTTLPEAPGASMNDLLAGITINGRGEREFSAPNLIRFMHSILREEEPLTIEEAQERGITDEPDADGIVWADTDDIRRFNDVVYGKRHIVKIEELGELVLALGKALGKDRSLPSGRSAAGR